MEKYPQIISQSTFLNTNLGILGTVLLSSSKRCMSNVWWRCFMMSSFYDQKIFKIIFKKNCCYLAKPMPKKANKKHRILKENYLGKISKFKP